MRVLARSTNQIWLSMQDLEWFVTYVAAEVSFGGVEAHEDEAKPAVAEGNCSVPGLRIRWDFQRPGCWTATFVQGPLQGRTVTSSVDEMTEAKWDAIAQEHGQCTTTWAGTTYDDRKAATWRHLEHHCRGLLNAAQ